MKTAKQVEDEFRAELSDLLAKYGAELEAKDYWQGYSECGADVRMTVTIDGQWDENGETVREYTEIDLGSSFSPTTPTP